MKGIRYPNVEVFRQTNWNGTTLLVIDWSKEEAKWRESFVIFMFIADNKIGQKWSQNC